MRLIYVIRSLHPVGGIERTLSDKANWLVAHGHEVMFVTYQQGLDKISFPIDNRIIQYDLECSIYSLYKYSYLSRIIQYFKLKSKFRKRFVRVLDGYSPDIVVVPIPNAEDFVWDIVHCSANIKIIIESHVSSDYFLYGKSITDHLSYFFFSPFKALRKSSLFVALTEHDASNWRKRKIKNIKVIPNPLSFFPEDNNRVSKTEGRIIAVGRLSNQKRFDRLIDAFSLIANTYPKWHVDIFGEGQLKDVLETQIERLGLSSRVVIHHFTKEIMCEYQCSQFLVLSSDYEGFGLVITEAMACGIPVISTDCPFGPSDIIEHGRTGLLTEMDANDLAKKIEWMIIHKEERVNMGIQAFKAATKYKKEFNLPVWEKAYMSVIV
jgi:glycosyltransferase involved in cell wall biosynthesis